MLTLNDLRTVPQAVLELLVVLAPLRGPATYDYLSQSLRVGRAAVYARVLAARRHGLVAVGGAHKGGRGQKQLVALTPTGRRIVTGGADRADAPPPTESE